VVFHSKKHTLKYYILFHTIMNRIQVMVSDNTLNKLNEKRGSVPLSVFVRTILEDSTK
jgi:hypothetical protein